MTMIWYQCPLWYEVNQSEYNNLFTRNVLGNTVDLDCFK